MPRYKKITFVIFLFITDVYSTYQLINLFPDLGSRWLGLFSCLLFINAVYIGWMQYLKHQPETVQRTIKFRIAGAKLEEYSLYDILNGSWPKYQKFNSLYTISVFSLAVIFMITVLMIMSFTIPYEKSSVVTGATLLEKAFAPSMYPYYLLFTIGTLSIVIRGLIYDEKDKVHGQLTLEYVIKFIQTLFISFFYSVGESFVVLVLISVIAAMRIIPVITEKQTMYPKDPVS